jgi:hypothetical protein
MHQYIAQKLHEERAARLHAEAAADRLARSAVRRPGNLHPRLPRWQRLSLRNQPADAASRIRTSSATVRPA